MTILAKPSFLEAALSAQREVEQQAIERCRVAEVERDAYAGKLHRLQARPAEARVAALEAEHTRLKADVNFHTERQAHWETVAYQLDQERSALTAEHATILRALREPHESILPRVEKAVARIARWREIEVEHATVRAAYDAIKADNERLLARRGELLHAEAALIAAKGEKQRDALAYEDQIEDLRETVEQLQGDRHAFREQTVLLHDALNATRGERDAAEATL